MSLESDTFDADLAALAWLLELGADEAIGEAPVNRVDNVYGDRHLFCACPLPEEYAS